MGAGRTRRGGGSVLREGANLITSEFDIGEAAACYTLFWIFIIRVYFSQSDNKATKHSIFFLLG